MSKDKKFTARGTDADIAALASLRDEAREAGVSIEDYVANLKGGTKKSSATSQKLAETTVVPPSVKCPAEDSDWRNHVITAEECSSTRSHISL